MKDLTVATFKTLDVVALQRAQDGLNAGAVGTVLEVYAQPKESFLVEFCNEAGETDLITELPASVLSKAS